MGRIFMTGDTHGDVDLAKLTQIKWPEQNKLGREDILLIAGDFGAPWCAPEDGDDRYVLDFHENKNYTTLFIDGNHENFDALVQYPETNFAGAKCHRIRPHVLHVERGEVLHLGGHRIWCMGGAISIDRQYRKEGVSWWPQEVPTPDEWAYAGKTLQREAPDIIVSHDTNAMFTANVFGFSPNPVSSRFDGILQLLFEKHIPVTDWYFGHYHEDFDLARHGIRYHELYQRVVELQ